MNRRGNQGSWTGDLGNLRVLGSELSALVRVVGALPWRSLTEDTLGDGDGDAVPVVLVHGLPDDQDLSLGTMKGVELLYERYSSPKRASSSRSSTSLR